MDIRRYRLSNGKNMEAANDPKARAQEALKDFDKVVLSCLGTGIFPLQTETIREIREALALSAALERVPEGGLKSMVFYKWLNGKWSFKASDNRRTKNQLSPISGEGPTPAAAILAAVEKMEKK